MKVTESHGHRGLCSGPREAAGPQDLLLSMLPTPIPQACMPKPPLIPLITSLLSSLISHLPLFASLPHPHSLPLCVNPSLFSVIDSISIPKTTLCLSVSLSLHGPLSGLSVGCVLFGLPCCFSSSPCLPMSPSVSLCLFPCSPLCHPASPRVPLCVILPLLVSPSVSPCLSLRFFGLCISESLVSVSPCSFSQHDIWGGGR